MRLQLEKFNNLLHSKYSSVAYNTNTFVLSHRQWLRRRCYNSSTGFVLFTFLLFTLFLSAFIVQWLVSVKKWVFDTCNGLRLCGIKHTLQHLIFFVQWENRQTRQRSKTWFCFAPNIILNDKLQCTFNLQPKGTFQLLQTFFFYCCNNVALLSRLYDISFYNIGMLWLASVLIMYKRWLCNCCGVWNTLHCKIIKRVVVCNRLWECRNFFAQSCNNTWWHKWSCHI